MTMVASGAVKLARTLAVVGVLLLLATMLWTVIDGATSDPSALCSEKLATAASTALTTDDIAGQLRIIDVWPKGKVLLGGRICLAVAGVAAKASENRSSTADVTLFLNDQRSQLTAKALAISGPQFLAFDLVQPSDASTDTAAFLRRLLGGKTRDGVTTLTVGLAKTASSTPDARADKPDQRLSLVVYRIPTLALGAASMVALIIAFTIFAANSSILRDSSLRVRDGAEMTGARSDLAAAQAVLAASPADPNLRAKADDAERAVNALEAKADHPIGTFSLGRTQIALWLALSIAGFIFLWLTLGLYLHVITAGILVLLGINGATGLAAIATQDNTAPQAQSKSFFADITSDATGPQLHRIQVVVWTCVLAVIFAWNVVWNFAFVDFDTNLLLLMGIANAMYLGFKQAEK
jgi:hypothetical protein